MTVRIDTDLPDGTRARAWVDPDIIVVEVNGRYTVAFRQRCGRDELSRIAAVLTEASQPPR